MAKALITSKIYLDNPGVEYTKYLAEELTYRIPIRHSSQVARIETIQTFKVLPRGIVAIPQSRTDLIPPDYEIVDKRVRNPVPFPLPSFELRQDQQEIYDDIAEGTCLLNAKVGWGKTFAGLHVARKFGQKTLVVTHTTALRSQWVKEVNGLYGIEPGIIGSSRFEIEDHPIVIGNTQSLVRRLPDFQKEFGTVIVDECHRVPSSTFTKILSELPAHNRVGLSGTITRKDGKHILFPDYFGYKVYQPERYNTIDPRVIVVKSPFRLAPDKGWTDKVTELLGDPEYQNFIAKIAVAKMLQGHSVLIIGDRTEFLENVQRLIGEKCVLVIGRTSLEDRDAAEAAILSRQKMCLAGSRSIFSEGISINALSTVILATPINNDPLLEQITGRIMRIYDDKKPTPEVIDINFADKPSYVQNSARMGFYYRQNWEVSVV